MSAVATKERPAKSEAGEPMRLTVERSDLLAALAHAAAVVERKALIPVLSNVLLDAADGVLSLTTTDLNLQLTLTVPAEVKGEGAITVSAALLHSIIREAPGDSKIELKMCEERLSVIAGRSRYMVAVLPKDQFPNIAANKPAVEFALPAKDLLTALSRVQFAQSVEGVARWYLCGVNLDIVDGQVTLAATDGDTLAWSTLQAPEGPAFPDGAILPTKLVATLSKLLDGREGHARLAFDEHKVVCNLGNAVVTGKLIDGDYPDWRRISALVSPKTLVVDAGSFAAAIRRVALVAQQRSRIVKIELSDDKLTASCSSFENGTAVEEMPCVWGDGEFVIGFHGSRLFNVLSAAGNGELHILLVDPTTPAIFTNPSDESSRWMITAARV